MTGSTRHSYKFANSGKQSRLKPFIEEYRRVVQIAIDQIWDGALDFNLKTLELPKFLHYKDLNIFTDLSPGVLQMAVNQAGAIIRGAVEKQRRRFWVKKAKGVDLPELKFSKPNPRVNPTISARCCDIRRDEGKFRGFVRLFYLGKKYGEILLPINDSSQYQKWSNRGKLAGSITLFDKRFQLSWKYSPPLKEEGIILGADQGLSTILSLSNGETTPETNIHGHSLMSITKGLTRKAKGSKSFARAQTHRKNFVHWSINRLNLSGVRQLKLEKIVNIRHGRKCSRLMTHWCNPLIRDKVKRRCEELGVQVIDRSSAYKSQRCSQCGLVRKSNREGKTYSCECGLVLDADINSAVNNSLDLPDIPRIIRERKLNLKGFYWKLEGFYTLDQEPIVPD